MAKMLKLVQNEYIKSLKKVSTKIMFILIIVFALGLVGLSKFAQKIMESDYFYMDEDSDYSYLIDDAMAMKYDGYELDIEKYTFMQENGISWSGWKFNACEQLFLYEVSEGGTVEYTYPEDFRNEIKGYIASGDWKSYCKKAADMMKSEGLDESLWWEYQYRYDHDIPMAESYREQLDWQNTVISSIVEAKNELFMLEPAGTGYDAEKAKYEDIVTLGIYRLENNKTVNVADEENIFMSEKIGFWNVFGTSSGLIGIIGLLIIILTGSTVSNEFSNGTIKFLLINPVKRWKILVSKYIMSISLGYIMVLLLYIISMLAAMAFFRGADLGADYLEVVDGAVKSTPGMLFILRNYFLASVKVVVMATLAFSISSLVRSSALAIGVSLFAMLSGNTLVAILKGGLKLDWARYLVFANTDLEAVANGTTGFSHHSMAFAVAVVAVHLVVFFLIAWDGFTKREV